MRARRAAAGVPELGLTAPACAQAAAAAAASGKRKAEELDGGAEADAGADAGDGEGDGGDEAAEAEAKACEPVTLGPKTFTTTEAAFRYFSHLLAEQTVHQDCNQARSR